MLPRAFFLISLAFAVVYGQDGSTSKGNNRFEIFCYFNSTRNDMRSVSYSTSIKTFDIGKLKAELCTHVIYGAMTLTDLYSLRQYDDIQKAADPAYETYQQLTALKNKNPDLKIYLSVTASSRYIWQNLASNGDLRKKFAENITNILTKNHLSGVNIDWQYPEAQDSENFRLLMKALKMSLRNHALDLITVLPALKPESFYKYNTNFITEDVDRWIIMATELTSKSRTIQSNAPLGSKAALAASVTASVNAVLSVFPETSRFKLILLIPFYGKSFAVDNSIADDPYGKTATNGVIQEEAYYDICESVVSDPNGKSERKQGWVEKDAVPWVVIDQRVHVYENPESVQAKTSFAISKGLGGVMAFSVDMDDFDGHCSKRNPGQTANSNYRNTYDEDSFPLLTSIYETVKRGPNSAAIQSSPLMLILAIIGAMLLKVYG
jgi:chitinase